MNTFKIIWPYYENAGQLKRQIDILNQYSKDVHKNIEVFLIDDASPKNPALPVLISNHCKIPIKLWRIQENIPWNQHGARNLGAKMAGKEGWLYVSDIDHFFEPNEMDKLLHQNLLTTHFYTFERVSLPEKLPYHYHCNSILIDRDIYWKAGGYDEDYCGSYGGDGQFIKAVKQFTTRYHFTDIRNVRVPREVQPDASTVQWSREEYKKIYVERLAEKKRAGLMKAINPLRFTWERQL